MNVSLRRRAPQLHVPVRPGHPLDGYYNDFRLIVRDHGGPDENRRALERLTGDRQRANPVSIAQLGLGAWQVRDADPGWLAVVRDVADWLVAEMNDEGLMPYLFPMSHTYRLEPPWTSALAQGETVSLLLRAAGAFGEPAFADAAERAAASLVDATSPLVATTADGPVLQEYPTDPPAHVLNGWIYALFGLYDLGVASADEASPSRALAGESFRLGCEALARRLPLYRVWPSWSRYDLYPHPLAHVASPFYHRLHVELLSVALELAPDRRYDEAAAAWERGAQSTAGTAVAVARKVAFRLLRPR